MAKTTKAVQARSPRAKPTGKARDSRNAAARRAMERDIDATLDRLDVGIAAQREAMDRLLEKLMLPVGT